MNAIDELLEWARAEITKKDPFKAKTLNGIARRMIFRKKCFYKL